MKSLFLYTFLLSFLLFPLGVNTIKAADYQEGNKILKSKTVDPEKNNGEGQGGEGEGEEDERQDKKKTKEKENQKKAKIAKNDDSSFGMLKDLFQSTFDYFYAPDSTKSEEIGKQR
ncbi:MAG: hypothetical protein R8P61_12510 [Bacteroidia bacterium]|nr:hypothetical protein [Bacteroidia bacterium]